MYRSSQITALKCIALNCSYSQITVGQLCHQKMLFLKCNIRYFRNYSWNGFFLNTCMLFILYKNSLLSIILSYDSRSKKKNIVTLLISSVAGSCAESTAVHCSSLGSFPSWLVSSLSLRSPSLPPSRSLAPSPSLSPLSLPPCHPPPSLLPLSLPGESAMPVMWRATSTIANQAASIYWARRSQEYEKVGASKWRSVDSVWTGVLLSGICLEFSFCYLFFYLPRIIRCYHPLLQRVLYIVRWRSLTTVACVSVWRWRW